MAGCSIATSSGAEGREYGSAGERVRSEGGGPSAGSGGSLRLCPTGIGEFIRTARWSGGN